MMTRACRKPPVSQGSELAAERLDGDVDPELFEDPLAEIDKPLAHHAMDRRDRSFIDDLDERRTMSLVQP
jgi:hypothetical protein